MLMHNSTFQFWVTAGHNGATSIIENSTAPELLPCQKNFFRPEGSTSCVANCHSWSAPSPTVTISTDVVVALSSMIGFFAGLAVLAISLIRYKQMWAKSLYWACSLWTCPHSGIDVTANLYWAGSACFVVNWACSVVVPQCYNVFAHKILRVKNLWIVVFQTAHINVVTD